MDVNDILESWKSEYGNIFLTEINEHSFIFRLLTYAEHEAIVAVAEDQLDVDEMICELCVLDPVVEDWSDQTFAGYIDTLGRLIREESLLTPRELDTEEGQESEANDLISIINQKSNQLANTFMMQLPVIIVHTFSQYTFEDIESMSLLEQIDLYTKANWALKNLEGVELAFDEK